VRWRWILVVATALPSACAQPAPAGAASPPPAAESDGDGDGVGVTRDRCPTAPEDLDGHEDEDGCPEADAPTTCVDEEGNLCLSE
jgi:hypothetical protein